MNITIFVDFWTDVLIIWLGFLVGLFIWCYMVDHPNSYKIQFFWLLNAEEKKVPNSSPILIKRRIKNCL